MTGLEDGPGLSAAAPACAKPRRLRFGEGRSSIIASMDMGTSWVVLRPVLRSSSATEDGSAEREGGG